MREVDGPEERRFRVACGRMRRTTPRLWARRSAAALGISVAVTLAGEVSAQTSAPDASSGPPACASLPTSPTTVLYVDGPSTTEGSALESLVAAILPSIGAFAAIVYVKDPPCTAINDLVTGAPGAATADYLAPGAAAVACAPSIAAPDLALSDVDPPTCSANAGTAPLSSAQHDYVGPVQAVAVVVPSSSTEAAISSDAAYVVFGSDASTYVVMPWKDPASIFTPGAASGPLGVVGATIGLSPARWPTATASTNTSTAALVAAVKADATPSAAIGILPMSIAQASGLKVLAFQAASQSCGYLPDSDSVRRDKINVRQGRYGLWAPVHAVARLDAHGDVVDSTGAPNAALTALVSALSAGAPSGSAAAAGDAGASASSSGASTSSTDAAATSIDAKAFLEQVAGAGFVPWCAMEVMRAADGSSEASYAPPFSCPCDFESTLGPTTRFCSPCQTDTDCSIAAPHCQFGYCEAQ